jgi:hypothetical protein
MFWKREKSFDPAGIRTAPSSPQLNHYTDEEIPACQCSGYKLKGRTKGRFLAQQSQIRSTKIALAFQTFRLRFQSGKSVLHTMTVCHLTRSN